MRYLVRIDNRGDEVASETICARAIGRDTDEPYVDSRFHRSHRPRGRGTVRVKRFSPNSRPGRVRESAGSATIGCIIIENANVMRTARGDPTKNGGATRCPWNGRQFAPPHAPVCRSLQDPFWPPRLGTLLPRDPQMS